MKANRSARRHGMDDDGVATAIGAVMLISILFIALILFQTTFVPRWEEDSEQRYAQEVHGQFAAIKTELDKRLDNASAAPISLPITMAEGNDVAFSLEADLPPDLSLAAGTAGGLQLDANELTIQIRDGESLAITQEEWQTIPGGETVSNIIQVSHLRLRIHDIGSESDGDSVSLEIIDAQGAFAGSLTATMDRHPPDYSIIITVENAAGDPIYENVQSYFQTYNPGTYWINALTPDYLFSSLLASTTTPFTLNIQENGMQGDFAIQFLQQTSGGTVVVGASGLHITDYNASLSPGALSIDLKSDRYPNQRFVIEHGAVVLEQPDGAVFAVEPPLEISELGAFSGIGLSFASPGGVATSVSGTRPAQVTLGSTDVISYVATAPRFGVRITTEWPTLWTSFWDDHLVEAGWSSASGHYAVSSGADWARLDLYGQTADPASTDHDLSISLQQGVIDTRIKT